MLRIHVSRGVNSEHATVVCRPFAKLVGGVAGRLHFSLSGQLALLRRAAQLAVEHGAAIVDEQGVLYVSCANGTSEGLISELRRALPAGGFSIQGCSSILDDAKLGATFHIGQSEYRLQACEAVEVLACPSFRKYFVSWSLDDGAPRRDLAAALDTLTRWAPRQQSLPGGLFMVENIVTRDEETELLSYLNSQPWSAALKRRVQHYGYRFNYAQLRPDVDGHIPLPPIVDYLVSRIRDLAKLDWNPDQLTVNEYLPGQGIGFHVDTHSSFTASIIVVSLGSSLNMEFRHKRLNSIELRLPQRSLLIFSDEARYGWTHGIKSRRTDADPRTGDIIPRSTRVSLTFRKLNWVNNFICSDCHYPDLCDSQSPSSLRLPERIKKEEADLEL